jgi:hypothetical protein
MEKNLQKVDVFLAGVIQGSQQGKLIDSQDYRTKLQAIFAEKLPALNVYCPYQNHSSSVKYDDEQGRKVFLDHLEMAKNAQLLIAYLPEASLGTAVEIWECHKAAVPIVAISPMAHNWVLRFFTDTILPDLDAFARWLTPQTYADLLKSHKAESL